jgi:hypothetical protein
MTGSSPSNDENFPLVTPLYSPLKLRGDEGGLWGRGRVGVNIQILSPLTSILSHRGERRYFVGLSSRQ